MHSYTELSPSGTGVHILFCAKDFQYDTGRYFIMNHEAGIEVYVAGATSKYVTLTGNRCSNHPFGERSQELRQVLETYMVRPNNAARNAINAVNSVSAPPDVLQRAMNCRSGAAFKALWAGDTTGYSSQSEADYALCSHLAFWTGRDAARMDELFRQSGLMRPSGIVSKAVPPMGRSPSEMPYRAARMPMGRDGSPLSLLLYNHLSQSMSPHSCLSGRWHPNVVSCRPFPRKPCRNRSEPM